MTDHVPAESARPLLSPAAERALEDLLAEKKAAVLETAGRSGKTQLQIPDIVSAYEDTERLIPPGVGLALRNVLDRERHEVVLTAVPLLVAFLSIVVSWAGLFAGDWSSRTGLVSALAAITSVVVGTSAWVVARRRSLLKEIMASERQILLTLSKGGAESARTLDTEFSEAARQLNFLRHWTHAERQLRRLYSQHVAEDRTEREVLRPIGTIVSRLVADGVLSPELSADIRSVANVRNHIAHQQALPTLAVQQAADRLTRLEASLERMLSHR